MGGVYLRYKDPERVDRMLKSASPHAAGELRRYELGEITSKQMIAAFRAQLGSLKSAGGVSDVIAAKDANIIQAIEKLRDGGYTVGLLTNVGYSDESFSETDVRGIDKSHFDVIVESCKVKLRKPDPRIFMLTAEKVGAAPEECIFLDDLWANCKSAEACGMTAIEVVRGDTQTAVKTLEGLLGKQLS
ncbi:unnamed protein product [Bursaphelenchus xylophilus]|uniref:(pine wood nematode) hypothetical protein n=1 Tax=Bursaphelenchus xylophilus TaxID=6326 RepID=A0A1I7RYJ8_BURXY|nr:unnamed protein product [Bursaphelenchus xylophilus]CAG9092606.1 unnamed protein product [Bursaphelenchus xylophilus]